MTTPFERSPSDTSEKTMGFVYITSNKLQLMKFKCLTQVFVVRESPLGGHLTQVLQGRCVLGAVSDGLRIEIHQKETSIWEMFLEHVVQQLEHFRMCVF